MTNDRDGIGDDERIAPADDSPALSDQVSGELSDPETAVPDADDVEDEMVVAERADGAEAATDRRRVDGPVGIGDTDDEADFDDEDEAAESAADETVGATAVASTGAAGSRSSARRAAAARSATTERKEAPTRQRDAAEKDGLLTRIGRFIREVVAELRKVIWPSRRQMITYTLVVITFLVVMTAFIAGLDVVFLAVVGAIFS